MTGEAHGIGAEAKVPAESGRARPKRHEGRDPLEDLPGSERHSMSYVQTVLGPIRPDGIGLTLPHEHTYCDLWLIPDRHDYAHQIADEDLLVAELADFRSTGGSCIVDVTTRGIGRDPVGLKRLSERSAVAIVMGSGWYREPYYPPEDLIDRRSVDALAADIVSEFTDGVADTGIKPGIIGEIGVHKTWVSALEERVCRAAARAACTTGMSVTTHSLFSSVGLDQLSIFEEEGIDPSRVVIGHADSFPFLDFYLNVIERGASIQFDCLGYRDPVSMHTEPRLIDLLLRLLDGGHEDRILLSHDVCKTEHLTAFGGNGYTYLAAIFLPRLRAAGVPETAIEAMTVRNPRRVLTLAR
jgi:predicted metal-dependent phosphotriesterase family hydrolase